MFSGGATADAVERLCGPDGLDLASRLVDRSLLVADTSGHAGALHDARVAPRLRLRAVAARPGGSTPCRGEHLAWCVELAARASVEARGADQLTWLDRVDAEHDNIRAALDHAVVTDPEAALRLTGDVILPWWFRGRRQEIRHWAEVVLAACGDRAPLLRAKVLANAGLMAEPTPSRVGSPATELHDELTTAERDHREAIALYHRHGTTPSTSRTPSSCCSPRSPGGPRWATRWLRARPPPSSPRGRHVRRGSATTTGRRSSARPMRSWRSPRATSTRAAADVEAAAPFVRRLGERFSSARLAYARGMLDDLAGNPRAAYRHVEQGLRLLSELGLHQAVTAQARMLAPLAERCGEPVLAAQWRAFVDDRDGVWTHYDGTVMAAAQNHAGIDALHAGELDRAVAALVAARDWYQGAGLHGGVAVVRDRPRPGRRGRR